MSQTILVTGSTSGFGRLMVETLARQGHTVFAGMRDIAGKNAVAAEELRQLAAHEQTRLHVVETDVTDDASIERAIASIIETSGRLDVVVNNAGGAPAVPADSASPRLHAKIIELNLLAPLHVSQAANAVMREQPEGGVILMVGSVSGCRPSPGTAAYGAAKAGLHHLATSLAMEWAPRVRVNSLVVGPVATGEGLDPAAVARTVPMGRPATPAEVAGACLLLASPLAGYVSGAALAVHGGGEWPGYLPDLRPATHPPQK